MPHSRRRKFSVQNNLQTRGSRRLQNAVQVSISNLDLNVNACSPTTVASNSYKCEEQTLPNTSKPAYQKKIQIQTKNKDVTASFNAGYLCYDRENAKPVHIHCDKSFVMSKEDATKFFSQSEKPKLLIRRERQSRHHRIKIRSPRRRFLLIDDFNKKVSELSTIGTNTENFKSIFKTTNDENLIDECNNIKYVSSNALEDMCRICHGGDTFSHELGTLISACSCRGTIGRVHVRCLERWLTESGKSRCELCGVRYITRRVHRYGVPRALVLWILSQNAKQLLVDTLGIILMSPLAILAAWLSGRTFAGLISQENNASPTPWPLASTFVLACMTLVCYYCWIVSAATRHALSWWIWYRSQYEVRLQLHSETDE